MLENVGVLFRADSQSDRIGLEFFGHRALFGQSRSDRLTYKFSGVLGNVRLLNGDTVKVDNEGSAQGSNQTTQTIQRTGIATAVGAIIGAIAGGGKAQRSAESLGPQAEPVQFLFRVKTTSSCPSAQN